MSMKIVDLSNIYPLSRINLVIYECSKTIIGD